MSYTSELSSFAARVREFIRASRCGPHTSLDSNPSARSADFEALALQLFALQFGHNGPYRRLCEARGMRPDTVTRWTQIPAAPTSAFKEFDVSCLPMEERTSVFHSSGTTGQKPSRHFHNARSLALYEASVLRWFAAHFQLPISNCPPGEAEPARGSKWAMGNWRLAILTPPPAHAPHSSLVHMFETIRRESGSRESRFIGKVAEEGAWSLDLDAGVVALQEASATGQPLLVLGTAFSFVHLLDHLADRNLRFELPPGSCALETGGYKGRSRSLPKVALHTLVSRHLGIAPSRIVCEYGMSELSSQAYDLEIGGLVSEAPGFANSNISFPLTPALSLRERAYRSPRVRTPGGPGKLAKRHAALPLPQGEGRGEGEQNSRLPSAAAFAAAPERPFHFPPWARVQIVSPETGWEVGEGETGLIRIFDLANVYSVMAIQTEDLGIRHGDGFALVGRAALAEPRGCSLMAV
jgi:hypothetical protein